ncbi:MAG: membrane protein insertase YidC [Phycisphaerales bacterium]|nr:membrane protein insertase YidC [Phycisphaerales bacterium]
MNKGLPRLLLTLLIVVFAGAVVAIVMTGKGPAKPQPEVAAPMTAAASAAPTAAPAAVQVAPVATPPAVAAAPVAVVPSGVTLVARAPSVPSATPTALGSLDPARDRMWIEFAPNAAGISKITFSDFWISAADRLAAIDHAEDIVSGANQVTPLPSNSQRYALVAQGTIARITVPMLAMHSIEVDGARVSLFGSVWSERAPGSFETTLVDPSGVIHFRILRSFTVRTGEGDGYDLLLSQSVENLDGSPHAIRLVQYGPGELSQDQGEMMDIRRFQFGYLFNVARDPTQSSVITHDAVTYRSDVLKAAQAGQYELWPSAIQKEQQQSISWFGTTNRYFSVAVHAPMPASSATPSKSAASAIEQVRVAIGDPSALDPAGAPTVFTELHSPLLSVAPGARADFSLGAFVGPLDRAILRGDAPYSLLEMAGLIVYQMGGCCSWCTFAWLANIMVVFLDFLHDYVVFDWGLAIVVLVLAVRLLLHPISKKSQVQMQRLSRGMAELKPELDALKSRYGDDPKRMQQEQMRLYREKGVNPAGCLGGFLPTFLQMPIWIALYAVLYLAFELRQQPAFFGIFQLPGGWKFLGDLSAQDRFIPLPWSVNLYLFTFTSVNLLPLLMGGVFYIQQKYMTPPTTVKLSPEQEQQQKMMRIMTVVMFPVMLYTAPSGLTLYIMTSTLVGIWESKRVRRHVEMTANQPVVVKRSKARDALGRLYERAMSRAQEKQQSGRTYKSRG